MNLRRKQQLARYAIIVGPFVLIFFILKVIVPALSGAARLRLLPDGYEAHEVAGTAASYEVLISGPDAREKAGRIAASIDDFFRTTAAPGNPYGLAPPGKEVRLVIFAKKEDLDKDAAFRLHTDLRYNGGYYDPKERAIALPEEGGPVVLAAGLRHEGAHLLFSAGTRSGLSRWLGEGLACYYEFAPVRAAKLKASAGLPLPPLAALLDATPEAFQSEANLEFYWGAELLVTYLLDGAGEARRSAFLDYVRGEMRSGPASSGTELPSRLGTTTAALERDMVEWLRTF